MKLFTKIVAIPLAMLSTVAVAGRHQICYQDLSVNPQFAAVWGCYEDAGGRCEVQPYTGPTVTSVPFVTTLPGNYVKELFITPATYSLDIRFFNAGNSSITPDETRSCEVNLQSTGSGAATSGAELAGFTTDQSGLLTTGVWKITSTVPGHHPGQTLNVPWEFSVVGGGVVGQDSPAGAFITRSEADFGNPSGWTGKTSDDTIPASHVNTVYAIAMRITGISARDLRPLLQYPAGPSSLVPVHHPFNSVQLTQGSVLLNGGTSAWADSTNSTALIGQFAYESYPGLRPPQYLCRFTGNGLVCDQVILPNSWHVASTDHLSNHPGYDSVTLITLPASLTINGVTWSVVETVFSDTSGFGQSPTMDVSGLLGEFALTGIGAKVELAPVPNTIPDRLHPKPGKRTIGSLLWKLQPRPDIAGATVASMNQGSSLEARITAYAIGVKLVRVDPLPPIEVFSPKPRQP